MEAKIVLKADNVVTFPGFREINGVICFAGRKYRSTRAFVNAFHALPANEYRRLDSWLVRQYNKKMGEGQERTA
jgi:hypothetical protein